MTGIWHRIAFCLFLGVSSALHTGNQETQTISFTNTDEADQALHVSHAMSLLRRFLNSRGFCLTHQRNFCRTRARDVNRRRKLAAISVRFGRDLSLRCNLMIHLAGGFWKIAANRSKYRTWIAQKLPLVYTCYKSCIGKHGKHRIENQRLLWANPWTRNANA